MPNNQDQSLGVSQDAPVPPHLADLRVQPESTWQTLKRNLTPQIDTSRSALGPGHQFDSGNSPQQQGEQQYGENFGSPLEQAYGRLKGILAQHEAHLSDRVLKPFRQSLDAMSEDLVAAGESGHTKTGGQLTYPTRLLAGGVGALLKAVPVGSNVKETVQAMATPPELGPEGRALSKELGAAQKAESEFRIAAKPAKHAEFYNEFHEAVRNTEGAELSDKGLTLDVVRHQKPEQAGERAIRTGVFFLPEKKSPYQRYYTTGRIGYGGTQRIEGRTTFENPIIAKGASGGKVPERAYDALNGDGAYDAMRQDVLDATVHGWGPRNDAETVNSVRGVLEKYGGNPDLAEEIVRNSKGGNTLPYAVQEHIVANSVRKAGHDGIIGYSKIKGQHRLSEVFDLRRDKYPISSQLFEPLDKVEALKEATPSDEQASEVNQKATEALGRKTPTKPKTPKRTPIAWASPPQGFRNGLPVAVGA